MDILTATRPARAEEIALAVPHSSRVRIQTVKQLRSAAFPYWLVLSVVRSRTLVLMWGASGSGKTFLALDLALSIARPTRWFGRRVRHGGVIYLAGEGHLKSRIDAYMAVHGLQDDDVASLRGLSTNLNLLDP